MEADGNGADTSKEGFKVLIAVDRSQHADFALEYYAKNLNKENHDVTLLYIMDPPDPSTKYRGEMSWEEALAREKELASGIEKEYASKLDIYKIKNKFITMIGYRTGEVIVEVANRHQVNMVVMGARGIGTLRRTILGGVSDYVVHHANCPVTVCRQGDGEQNLKKIV